MAPRGARKSSRASALDLTPGSLAPNVKAVAAVSPCRGAPRMESSGQTVAAASEDAGALWAPIVLADGYKNRPRAAFAGRRPDGSGTASRGLAHYVEASSSSGQCP
jgi:hypothetical protein